MNYTGIIRLVDTTGKARASNRYWGRDQRQQIMDRWAEKYPEYSEYGIVIRPAIDHKTALLLGQQYPQLRWSTQ